MAPKRKNTLMEKNIEALRKKGGLRMPGAGMMLARAEAAGKKKKR